MKIISASKTQNYNPAIGWELFITLSNGCFFKVWSEWIWHINYDWDGDPNSLIGFEVNQEWVNQYASN